MQKEKLEILRSERTRIIAFLANYRRNNSISVISVGKGLKYIPTGHLSKIANSTTDHDLVEGFRALTDFEVQCLRENGLFLSEDVTKI